MKSQEQFALIIMVLVGILIFTIYKYKGQIVSSEDKIVQLNQHLDSLYKILDGLPLGSPLDTVIIDDEFGIRRHPILRIWRRHWGIDLKGTYRDTIYATGPGTIKKAKWIIGYGNYVIIKHKAGYESLYAHMNKIFVKKDQKIKRGDKIGTVGSSGLASGPHLHYEISRNGIKEDPKRYINER